MTDQIAQSLIDLESELRLEQAVYGMDSWNELKLQAHLARSLAQHYTVSREAHYPSARGKQQRQRKRCDLSLFTAELGSGATDTGVPLWLEIKVAYQFREGGLYHRGYSAIWRNRIAADIRKMESDTAISDAALVLIVFSESAQQCEKDLVAFELLLADTNVLAGFRHTRHIAIQNRIGHSVCTVALWPTLQEPH